MKREQKMKELLEAVTLSLAPLPLHLVLISSLTYPCFEQERFHQKSDYFLFRVVVFVEK